MRGSRWVLVKVVLFQLRGPGHHQNDTTPNFFPNSDHLFLNSIRTMIKTTKAFSRKLAVPRYLSTSVCPPLNNFVCTITFLHFWKVLFCKKSTRILLCSSNLDCWLYLRISSIEKQFFRILAYLAYKMKASVFKAKYGIRDGTNLK